MLVELVNEHLKKVNAYKQQIRDEALAAGIQQGLKQAATQQQETLLERLADRFGKINPRWQEEISKIQGLARLGKLTRSILKVNTPTEFDEILDKLK